MYYIHHNQTGRDSATGVGFHAKDAVWNIPVILCLLYSAGATMRPRRKDFLVGVQEGDTPNRGENDEPWDWMGLDGIGGYPIHPAIQRNPAAPFVLKSVSPATHGFLGIWHCVHITPTDIYSDFVSDRPERDSDNRSDISNVLTSYPTYNTYIYIYYNKI